MKNKRCNDSSVATIKTAETMTFRPEPDTYRAVRRICGDLCISGQEFLRRAVEREIDYNERRIRSKK